VAPLAQEGDHLIHHRDKVPPVPSHSLCLRMPAWPHHRALARPGDQPVRAGAAGRMTLKVDP
jgi:hypothetical protein